MEVSQFKEKLNKVEGNVYVIEEAVQIVNGMYEAELIHDNVNESTLSVYTGPKLTGNRIQSYAISTPSMTPWKRVIRVYADVPRVYISYETDGDTVEAEDVNRLQESAILTQKALNDEVIRAETVEESLANDILNETVRAESAERVLSDNLAAETSRAEEAEKKLTDDLFAEITRATGAEATLTENLSAEAARATEAERKLTTDLLAEETRSKAAEKKLTDNLSAEISRATGAEEVLTDNLAAETTRATGAEKTLTSNLNAEVTRAKAAEKTNSDSVSAEVSRATAAENDIRSTISTNKPNWDDKYTKNEVDNKFSALETAIDWKEAVATFADLATTYPKPDDGWTVNVKDIDYTYRWSGTAWIAISANAIPKATQSVDGLLSKEDKASLDDTNAKKHTHSNKSTLDKLTETLLTNWTDAYNKRHEHGNKSVIDKITQILLDNWTAAYTHIGDAVKHITATERANWNDANSKKHTHENKSIIDKLTQAMLDKLSGIATGAEVNVQADWNVVDENSDAYIKNKPSAMPASDVLAWAKAANKPAYSWSEITSKPSTFAPSAHNHAKSQITDFPSSMPASDVAAWAKAAAKPSYGWTEITGKPSTFAPSTHSHPKSQITDMPTKLSQFTNDAGYITQADVDTSQSHTHTNKLVLDKITQAMLDKLAGIAEGANKYVHPNTAGNKHIPAGGSSGQILRWSAAGTAVWGSDNNTTYSAFKAATASAAGGTGLVPAPAAGAQAKYLRADGTWQTPPDTKYSHPNSGVVAGDYQSVTVNAQGHVTGGVPKGAFTWAQLKGAYTWGQLKGGS